MLESLDQYLIPMGIISSNVLLSFFLVHVQYTWCQLRGLQCVIKVYFRFSSPPKGLRSFGELSRNLILQVSAALSVVRIRWVCSGVGMCVALRGRPIISFFPFLIVCVWVEAGSMGAVEERRGVVVTEGRLTD